MASQGVVIATNVPFVIVPLVSRTKPGSPRKYKATLSISAYTDVVMSYVGVLTFHIFFQNDVHIAFVIHVIRT